MHNQEEVCLQALTYLIPADPNKYTDIYSDLKRLDFKVLPSIEVLGESSYRDSLFVLAGLEYSDKRIPDNQYLWARILARLNVMPGCSIYVFEHIIYDQADGLESLLSRTLIRLAEKLVKCYDSGLFVNDLKSGRYSKYTYK
jgi:hypothetical protein